MRRIVIGIGVAITLIWSTTIFIDAYKVYSNNHDVAFRFSDYSDWLENFGLGAFAIWVIVILIVIGITLFRKTNRQPSK